jgi:hypothetical protein
LINHRIKLSPNDIMNDQTEGAKATQTISGLIKHVAISSI